jgi:hypothetical protein
MVLRGNAQNWLCGRRVEPLLSVTRARRARFCFVCDYVATAQQYLTVRNNPYSYS